jgi:hypothetical protein
MKQQVIPWHQLTAEQAMNWLLINDPEGDWGVIGFQSEILQEAVGDNLFDFGEDRQSGDVIVTF